MPELPEVETTRNGIAPHIEGRKVKGVIVRERKLRWPIPENFEKSLQGQIIKSVSRRGKYLLFETKLGWAMIHLGMSGSLRIVTTKEQVIKHDHVDIEFNAKVILRYHDPRKFGSLLWFQHSPDEHPLLVNLGPEPLSDDFELGYLFQKSRKRNVPIKTFIMDSHVVVGVGNIYANEALFIAGIDPRKKAGKISNKQMYKLVAAIKFILDRAIKVGGTTLKDFVGGDGKPGYFSQSLAVYGRANKPCTQCEKPLTEIRIAQRSTVFCKQCQK